MVSRTVCKQCYFLSKSEKNIFNSSGPSRSEWTCDASSLWKVWWGALYGNKECYRLVLPKTRQTRTCLPAPRPFLPRSLSLVLRKQGLRKSIT